MAQTHEIEMLRQLADPFEDFIPDRDDGRVLFYRGGVSYELVLKKMTGAGLFVSTLNGERLNVPFLDCVRVHILNLPRLSGQIIKSIQAKNQAKFITPIDSPIEIEKTKFPYCKEELIKKLSNPLPFSTRILQLMAPAGQGKSVLLDMVALETAKQFGAGCPMLLNIDLLGRYVGSIEDAIAGAMNNTYAFSLSQRDIILCIKNDWLVLALDGFDELVARVGAKEAFQKLSELIDQVDGCGTFIVSARESFFDAFNIKISSQSYLRPKTGLLATEVARLLPWRKENCLELMTSVCRKLDVKRVDAVTRDYEEIIQLFSGDSELLNSPFFLKKTAELWYADDDDLRKGDFKNNKFARIQYVIEKYVEREAKEKWISRSGQAISDRGKHLIILGSIAEEIFRSSTQKLSQEELKLSTQMSLLSENLDPKTVEALIDKVQTHSVFESQDKQYTFSHVQFSNYYLAQRLFYRFKNKLFSDMQSGYCDKEISQEVFSWLRWLVSQENANDRIAHVQGCLPLLKQSSEQVFLSNISSTIFCLLDKIDGGALDVENLFVTNGIDDYFLKNIIISNSTFTQFDVSRAYLENVKINTTRIAYMSIAKDKTRYKQVQIHNCEIGSVEVFDVDDSRTFAPVEVENLLARHGFVFLKSADDQACKPIATRLIDKEVVSAVRRMIKKANKFNYFRAAEIEDEGGGKIVYDICKVGVECEVMSSKSVHRSGPDNVLNVFLVDKDLLLKGSEVKVDDARIEKFWSSFEVS